MESVDEGFTSQIERAITHIQLAFDTPDFHKLTHTWLSTTLVKK